MGPAFIDDDIALFLDSLGARYRRFSSENDLLRTVAERLAGGQIVGWFHGRMEYGPRALGCRSIIGDARAADMQQRMNLKIKFRESFRPFAPVVLREYVDQVFQMRPNEDSPYMLFVAPVRETLRIATPPEDEAKLRDPDLRIRVAMPRSSFPAITHVDYSARIQTVDQARHGRFYRLMKQFYELTGSPVLVNTSFNIRGEPIVCTPEQALRSFMATEIDCLVIEDCVVTKEDLPANLFEDSWKYRAEFALD